MCLDKNLRVLVACEESQILTKLFREREIEAFSCDILPCSGGHPEWHKQEDVIPLLDEDWDLIIAFPPCTYLTVTGNRWFNVQRYGQKALERAENREDAVEFFMRFANSNCNHVAIENPVGVMSSIHRKPDQIIHPYMFGDPYEKRTCLWLKNLPKLMPTNTVIPEPRNVYKSGKSMPSWYDNCWGLTKEERSRARSKTFPGVAEAMVSQWLHYLQSN
jgi:hypothetical protein